MEIAKLVMKKTVHPLEEFFYYEVRTCPYWECKRDSL